MIKLVTNDSYDFGDLGARLVPLSRRGVDQQFTKSAGAGVFHEFLNDIKPIPGKTVIHVLAVGDEEKYGPNRNADAFSGKDNKTAHASFKDIGHVFRNHQSDDPQKAVGEVLATAHNPLMHRIELMLALDNKKCAREVQAVNEGREVPVSMGSMQKFDVCSYCGHEAPTARDHCFGPGTLILMDNGSVKEIQDIAVGDRVIDADGIPVSVLKTFVNSAAGPVYRLHTTLASIDTIVTGNHPILTAPAELGSCRFSTRDATTFATCWRGTRPECVTCRLPEIAYRYTPAAELRVGDYVRSPVIRGAGVTPACSLEKAWVIGLFAAEGSYAKLYGKRNGIQFSLHKDETEYVDRMRRFFLTEYGKDLKVYKASGANGISARIHSKEIAAEFLGYVGEYAHHKQFSLELMSWPDEYLWALIRGLFDGDGHTYQRPGRRNRSKLNTASPHFAFQIRQLAMRLGHEASVGVFMTVGGPTNRSNKFTQYYVATTFFVDDASPAHSLRRQVRNGHMSGCVSELEQIAYEGPVYNFETTTGSYVANGVAVHNCDHVKNMLGLVAENGQKIYMQNPNPKYFDISTVFKPADRIAYTLRKVASGMIIGGHDLAVSAGLSDWGTPKYALKRTLATLVKRVPAVLKATVKPAKLAAESVTELRKHAQLQGLDHLLAFLHENGWLLSPGDFGRTIGADPALVEAGEDEGSIDKLMDDDSQVESLDEPMSPHDIPMTESLRQDLDRQCGMGDQQVNDRVLQVTIMGAVPKTAGIAVDQLAAGLGLLYGHYKLAFGLHHHDHRSMLKNLAAAW